jgi:predicted alpha/beta superfamily hydrolase
MRRLITILAIINCLALSAADYHADTITIASFILNEPRDIVIYEPAGIHETDSVHIVYLLDGEFSNYRYEKIAREHFDKAIVGIGIINTNRNRDMLPAKEPENFLEFIEKELIPEVEKRYTIEERILFGHSFAGGFTLYAMIHRPGLFNKYITSSPTPIMKMVNAGTYMQLDNELKENTNFFFSYGSKDMKQVKKWSATLKSNLQMIKFKHLQWKNEVNEGESHNTNDIVTLIKGLH